MSGTEELRIIGEISVPANEWEDLKRKVDEMHTAMSQLAEVISKLGENPMLQSMLSAYGVNL